MSPSNPLLNPAQITSLHEIPIRQPANRVINFSVALVEHHLWKFNFRCDIIVPVRSVPEPSNQGDVNGADQPG